MLKNKKNKTHIFRRSDSVYILKLVVFLILGSLWIRLVTDSFTVPLPLGFVAGLLIARTDRFQLDRKIEYAFLVMAMFVGFWLPIGLELVL